MDKGARRLRFSLPMLREPGTVPPCYECPKIPAGVDPVPENAVNLSDRNWAAYVHYSQCAAVGRHPDDPIADFNAGIIDRLERDCLHNSTLQAFARLEGGLNALTVAILRAGHGR